MNGTTHTPKLAADVADGKRFLSAIKSAPEDKLVLASAIAEAFINGMITQERLAAPVRRGRIATGYGAGQRMKKPLRRERGQKLERGRR